MRVVEPHEFKAVKHPKKKRKPRIGLLFAAVLIVAASAGLYSANRDSTSAVKATQTERAQSESNPQTAIVPAPAAPARTYQYCTEVRGVSKTELAAFNQQVEWTLNMSRGWSLSGKLAFKKADTGCDFTMWLASPDDMASFGGVCDAEWSCRIGDAVVANYEKWQNASAAWRDQEGNIDLYRVMLINHEVGHWFGFEHKHCEGPGQPAPVMQQQSIDLQGCAFNPWPTAEERAALQKQLNL